VGDVQEPSWDAPVGDLRATIGDRRDRLRRPHARTVPSYNDTTPQGGKVLAAYNTFGQVMWTMLVFFAWILFFWLLFAVFGDLFRRTDVSGWGRLPGRSS
jgi:hypothetical protein